MLFQDLNLSNSINSAVNDLGFSEPTEIQEKTIPILMTYDGDFVGQAQTGTGKTASFVIPLLENIDFESKFVQSIILAPTRELAKQVSEEIEKLSKYLPIKVATVYGGVSYNTQITNLRKNCPQIVVGTPGRVIDLINKRVLVLKKCSHIIIDEADEMLNMGFIEDVQIIIDSLNKNKKMWMFSATMPDPIINLIRNKFSKPKVIRLEKKVSGNDNIDQFYCIVKRKYFSEALQRFIDSTNSCFGMIFCETRQETKELSELLLTKGLSIVSLHGELNQMQRDTAMKKFKDRKANFLVCTSVAARGIDVSNISHVFNMGLPRQSESYIHRIGRTGRAGEKGIAISFITPNEFGKLRQIERLMGKKIGLLKLPHPKELKKIKIFKELDKMNSLKTAIVLKDDTFQIDAAYKYFESYFENLSKEQILKLMFTHRFNKEIRQIDDSAHLEVAKRSNKSNSNNSSFRGGRRRKSSNVDNEKSGRGRDRKHRRTKR